jgi:riboflavin synthase
LTVVEFDQGDKGGWFTVWLANETLDRTDLGTHRTCNPMLIELSAQWCDFMAGSLKEGDNVNLERAMGGHTRFGGHFVQAHVDGTATILSHTPDGDSLRLVFQLPEETPDRASLLPYIVPKGYVALDGASLTVTQVDDTARTFGVMLIKHTRERITLGTKEIGAKVNVEVDMVGKYVEKSVSAALGGGGSAGTRALLEKIVEDVLHKKGLVI